jgi:hypothetical protein
VSVDGECLPLTTSDLTHEQISLITLRYVLDLRDRLDKIAELEAENVELRAALRAATAGVDANTAMLASMTTQLTSNDPLVTPTTRRKK